MKKHFNSSQSQNEKEIDSKNMMIKEEAAEINKRLMEFNVQLQKKKDLLDVLE